MIGHLLELEEKLDLLDKATVLEKAEAVSWSLHTLILVLREIEVSIVLLQDRIAKIENCEQETT